MVTRTRTILIRARNIKLARRFAKDSKEGSNLKFLPERVVSVKLNKSAGLAGGVKGFNVKLKRDRDTRQRVKGGILAARFRGKIPRASRRR